MGLTESHEFVNPATANADERELGSDEEPVGGNQAKDGNKLSQDKGQTLIHYEIVHDEPATGDTGELAASARTCAGLSERARLCAVLTKATCEKA